MKKLLAALFLLALFLTSCSTADGGETSGTPDTTAPEITTDEVTTSGETEYVEPEGILLSEILGKWYFDWTPSPFEIERVERNFQNANYSEADRQYALKTPILYKTETGGIKVEFCFFKEYYKLGEVIQVRITIQNETEEPYTFQDSPMYGTGLETHPFSPYAPFSTCSSTAWMSPEDRMSFLMEPITDFMLPITLSPGESVHIERVFPEVPVNKAKIESFWYRLNGWFIRIPVSVVQLLPTFSAPEGSPLSSVSGDWYFDWQPFEQYVAAHEETVKGKGLSDAERAALIKTPTRYICESNGLTFDVIFFRETYKNGEAMQVRIAVTNHTDETVEFMDFPSLSTRLVSDGGETLYADLNWMKQSERFSYYNEPTEHGMAKTTLLPEETAVFERVILLDGLETYAGDLTFEYSFGKVFSGGEYATVRVPIELVP